MKNRLVAILFSLLYLSLVSADMPSIDVVSCSEPCKTYSTVFTLSDSPIRIVVLNQINATIIGEVKLPTNNTKDLFFHSNTALLIIENTGKYMVGVNVSKEGLGSVERKHEIIVLADHIPTIIQNECNGDGKCNGAETNKNCPQDCLPSEGMSSPNDNTLTDAHVARDEKKEDDSEAISIDWVTILSLVLIALIIIMFLQSRQ